MASACADASGFENRSHAAEAELAQRAVEFDEVHDGFSCFKFLVRPFDEVAIESELADQWIDLAQTQRQLGVAFQITSNEVIMARAGFQSDGAASSVEATPYLQ